MPSAWSLVQETTIHVVSVAACYSALYVLFFAPVLLTGRLLGAGDLIYHLPNFIRGTKYGDLANFAPADLDHLDGALVTSFTETRGERGRLGAFRAAGARM